jgi:hypothetical protein
VKRSISALLIGGALSLVAAGAAHAQDKTIKIGVLTDNSGLYSDLCSAGSTLASQMAIEDSGYWDYWDLNDGARAFSKRTKNNEEPSMVQASVYSGSIHSLRHHNVIEREG